MDHRAHNIRLSELAEALRTELARRIKARDCSTAELARRTHFSQPHVSQMIAGKRRLSAEAADAIALASGIRFEDLLIEDNGQPRTEPIDIATASATRSTDPRHHGNRGRGAAEAVDASDIWQYDVDLPPAA